MTLLRQFFLWETIDTPEISFTITIKVDVLLIHQGLNVDFQLPPSKNVKVCQESIPRTTQLKSPFNLT